MAKLLVISANLMDDPYPVYPLGANLVANSVKKSGHEVKILDLLVDGDNCMDGVISEFKPDYIALAMRNVDNVNFKETHTFILQYKSVISRIKNSTGVPIILGGTAFTIFPDKFIEYLGADYGITGPGEISLPKLIEDLEHKNQPDSRVIRGKTDYSGENCYYLGRENRLAEFYLNQGGMLNISSKRGCPHKCLYCSYPNLEGNKYIFRQPESVVDEIDYLMAEHAADYIFFTDSVFNDKDNQYLLIMEEMARRGISILWTCYMRPAKFQNEEVELMKRTGLHSVEWGTDCSSDRTLAGMKKNFRWDEVQSANNLFAKHNIPGSHFIIFGGPGENQETVREGIKNLSELDFCVVFGGTGVRVFPDTGISKLAKSEGLIVSDNELFEKEVFYHSPEIDIEWLNNFLLEAFSGKRHWIYPWTDQAIRNQYMHNSGIRGPLWENLLKKKTR